MWVTSKGNPAVEVTHFGEWTQVAWSQILDLLENGLLRGRKVGSLLVHAFTPITHIFLPHSQFLCFLCFLTCFPCFLSFSLLFPFPLCFCSSLLCTSMAFYIACRDKIYHFYPLTTFGLLWVSFQDCPLVYRLPSHHHYTVLAVPCLIPKQK